VKFLLTIAVAVALASVAYAAATTLSVNGNSLQYGEDADLSCTDNVAVWYQTTTGPSGVEYVTTVSLGGMHSDCNGVEAKVVLTDGTVTPLWVSGYVTIAGGSAGFPVPANTIEVEDVDDIHVTVVQHH
jgi:hypothetical protein